MTNGGVPEQTTLYHGQLFAQRPGVAPDDLSKCFLKLGTRDRAGQEEWERKPECQRPKLSSRGTLAQRGQRGTGQDRSVSPRRGDGPGCLLEVDVGADQHVIEQENPAFLGLDQLPAVTVHGLRQRLTKKQLPLA